jgi:hypothetical protein
LPIEHSDFRFFWKGTFNGYFETAFDFAFIEGMPASSASLMPNLRVILPVKKW